MAEAASSLLPPVPVAFPVENDQEAGSVKQTHCRVCLRSDGRDLISPCKCEGPSKFVHRRCLDYERAKKEPFAFAHCTTCKAPYYLMAEMHAAIKWNFLKFFKFRYMLFLFAVTQFVICSLGYILYLISDNQHYFDRHKYSIFRDNIYDVGVKLYYEWQHDGFIGVGELDVYYALGFLFFGLILALSGCFVICYRICNDPGQSCQELHTFAGWNSYVKKAVECEFMGDADKLWVELLFIMDLLVIAVHTFTGAFFAVILSSVFGHKIWKHHYCVRAKIMLTREYVVEDAYGVVEGWCPPPLRPDQAQDLKKLGLL